jgi:hypothetical protein
MTDKTKQTLVTLEFLTTMIMRRDVTSCSLVEGHHVLKEHTASISRVEE